MEKTLGQATAEAVQMVNTALTSLQPGPEMFLAVDPAAINVTWREPGNNDLVSRGHQDKLDIVRGLVRRELSDRLHQLPQVLIVDDTGGLVALYGTCQFGRCDPALVFPG
jgi:hypothetical protein